MEWVTTTAKTLPEAIDLALDNLGVDESEAEIVVLEEPSKGLFGRMRGSARVEARVKPRAIRPKHDRGRSRRSRSNDGGRGRGGRGRGRSGDNRSGARNDQGSSGKTGGTGGSRRRGRGRGGSGDQAERDRAGQSTGSNGKSTGGSGGKSSGSQSSGSAGKGKDRAKSAKAASNKGNDRSRSRTDGASSNGGRSDAGGREPEDSTTALAGVGTGSGTERTAADTNNKSGSESGSKGGRRRDKQSGGRSGTAADETADSSRTDTGKEETRVEDVAEHLRTFLGGLTEAFGLEGEVDIDNSEPDVLVATVQGQHGLMVGPKGRTLDAIQDLARVSSQRAAPSNIRIRVDVGGYRSQRAAALGDFARKAANKAVDNASEVALEPMSPADRKAVHDALVDDSRVETRSVGTEPRRRVIVIPAEDAVASSDAASDSDGSDEEE